MKFTWFATFQNTTPAPISVSDADTARVTDLVSSTPGLTKGLIYTPWPIDGLPHHDGPSPVLQLQLYFDDIKTLEAAIGKAGHLQALANPATLPSMAKTNVTEQAMLVRHVPVVTVPNTDRPFCTYVVHYPGPADDLNLWLRHYIDGHTPVMRRFPGIRGVELSSRMDWCSALPWDRVNYMQRNKVVFDDARALRAALNSPVMQDMRADSGEFPPFSGGNAHFPMRTVQVGGDTA